MSNDPTSASGIAAGALAATAIPTDAETADAMAQLADVAGHASSALYDYRRNNPNAPDIARALNLEMTLDQRAIDLRVKAVTLLGAQAADAVAQMKDAAGQVDAFFATVKKIEGQLTLASALLGLASAALVGDAGGILGAVVSVHTALKSAQS
jgi:hypothetical protein